MTNRQMWVTIIAASAAFGLQPSVAQADKYDLKRTVRLPSGWEVNVTVEFTKDCELLVMEAWNIVNDTGETQKPEFEATAPEGTNDRKYHSKYTRLGAGAGRGVAEVDGETVVHCDLDIDDWAEWGLSHGFALSPFVSPVAIADLNSNGELDESDGSLYGRIDPDVFHSHAHDDTQFPLGGVFTTNSSGEVDEWRGLTFYTDEGHTTLYANQQILIVEVSEEKWVKPAPAVSEWGKMVLTLLVLTGLTIAVGWRRRAAAA